MTEVQAEYKVKSETRQVGVKWCRCPQCQTVYGYEEDGGERLRVGKLKMVAMRAECGECGYTIWWYSSDRHMRKITKGRTPSPPAE